MTQSAQQQAAHWCQQGMQHAQSKQWQAAVACYERVVRQQPQHSEAERALIYAQAAAGQVQQAQAHTQAYMQAGKAAPQAWVLALSCLFEAQGALPAAWALVCQLPAQDPALLRQRAALAYRLGHFTEALDSYQALQAHTTERSHALHGQGDVHLAMGQVDAAKACYLAVLQDDPGVSTAHNNLANIYQQQGDWTQAIAHFQQALHGASEPASVWNNLGSLYSEMQRHDAAQACYQKALQHQPDMPEARWGMALIALCRGDLAAGWRGYRHGLFTAYRRNARFPFPEWQGQPLPDKTLLLYGEQGLGDEMLFLSCLPDVLPRVGRCLVECDARLHPLIKRRYPAVQMLARQHARLTLPADSALRPDYCLAIGELPRLFRGRLEDFPQPDAAPTLLADAGRIRSWRDWLASLGTGPYYGVAWRSGDVQGRRAQYHTDCTTMLDHLPLHRGCWISVQYDLNSTEAQLLHERGVAIPPGLDLKQDIDGVAALCSALDHVVSSRSCLVDIAAGVGTRVDTLFPHRNWTMLGTAGYPWYPSCRALWNPDEPGMKAALHRMAEVWNQG